MFLVTLASKGISRDLYFRTKEAATSAARHLPPEGFFEIEDDFGNSFAAMTDAIDFIYIVDLEKVMLAQGAIQRLGQAAQGAIQRLGQAAQGGLIAPGRIMGNG